MIHDAQLYFPKELSWLSFNERVLQEAADKQNPIVERIRFLGIYSNNMDEFFRVRVADVRRQIAIHHNNQDEDKEDATRELLDQIQERVIGMTREFDRIFKELVTRLGRYNIHLISAKDTNEYQQEWLTNFFKNKVLRHIAPILIDGKTDLVGRLKDSGTYLIVQIKRNSKNDKYAVVEVPTNYLSRFIMIPPEKSRKKKHIILLDNIIKLNLDRIFRGFVKFDSLECYSFKMTRDAEYKINDEIDESYMEKMSESMKQRLIAEPVRFTYDADMPEDMLTLLRRKLNISSLDSIIAGGPVRNFRDFIGFPNVGREYLENPPLPAIHTQEFSHFDTVFQAITEKDRLLYYPYHRFLHLTEFVRQAAIDPSVRHIRMNLYRLASKSRIINSLIDAVDNGKMVTVVMELQARFDEEANIEWSKIMREAGIKVLLGIPTLKIHSKLCVVSREEKGDIVHYAHIGTGNFNEKTAKIYTDFSLFTRNQEIAQEAVSVFDLIQFPYKTFKFQHLQVSPLNSRTKIQSLIRQEIQHVIEGKKGRIRLKINNLVDKELIDDLYKASQAGIKIKAIVRGMCSLIPGIKGISENISIISIVDRFLEHPRVAVFDNGGEPKVFISSADWMTRNMDNRIEVGCPIYDEELKKRIIDIMEIQFKDTTKARVIDQTQSNKYVPRGNRKKIRSQIEIYDYLKDLEDEADTSDDELAQEHANDL
ncbi:polyphosphate kinase 1 [Paraneptunicella aestuarii]|uniref:polyphosphate kinase 1 n=1 Tax=Paraneptunicella aestuarii TaxID=2831148 RepID=UPI001E5188AD|nr:polyphosphate kinase 1 [Paraneptunicella aestuarii]UAA37987.1 polyphosphate kinase 1 [Paraneptunicella aestuarii]